MASWWKKKVSTCGMVLFRGNLPDRMDNYRYLEQMGISITPTPEDADNVWSMTLRHPEWGEALVLCPRIFRKPPDNILQYVRFLSDAEREAIRASGTGLVVWVKPQHGNVLRDRKLALRYLHALMGKDGVAAIDMQSQLYWTPDMLADELCHDADLDVEALYCLHAVRNKGEEQDYWTHSHGLKEIGFFDFSIINPAKNIQTDFFRSQAFRIVEGEAKVGEKTLLTLNPRLEAKFVSMRDFIKQGDRVAVKLIEGGLDESHLENGAVFCDEPQGGWQNRISSKGISPSRALVTGLPENCLMIFSKNASDLMAERARGTYSVFRSLWEELSSAGLAMHALAKVWYVTDNGNLDDKEHLWFEVKGFTDNALDAILVNQPYKIARMKEGDRGMRPVEQLSDWVIITPAGHVTPRNTSPARVLRNLPSQAQEKLREALRKMENAGH